MCAITPVRITKIKNGEAQTTDGRTVKLALVPNAKVGDYIQVFANLAFDKMEEENAKEMLKAKNINKC